MDRLLGPEDHSPPLRSRGGMSPAASSRGQASWSFLHRTRGGVRLPGRRTACAGHWPDGGWLPLPAGARRAAPRCSSRWSRSRLRAIVRTCPSVSSWSFSLTFARWLFTSPERHIKPGKLHHCQGRYLQFCWPGGSAGTHASSAAFGNRRRRSSRRACVSSASTESSRSQR